MQFTITPTIKLTKALLLEHKTEEEYMSFYLGINPDDELHCNPLRPDKRPTCSFYRSKSKQLIFKDWKTNWHASFVDIVSEKYKCTYTKALKIIANDFGIIDKEHYEKHEAAIKYDGNIVEHEGKTFIQAEVKDYTKEELNWWLSFGITEATLKKYNVFSIKSVFLNGNFIYGSTKTNPIYGYYYGKEEGRELWKMYFPIKTSYRFLLNTSKLQGVKQLPATGDILVVTKSMKDVMVLHEMGVPAIAPQAESVIITARQYAALSKRFKRIVFNGDWDEAGRLFMSKSRKAYPSIALTFTDQKKHAKDVSDFVKKFGYLKAKPFIDKVKQAVLDGKFDRQLKYCKST